MHVHVCMRVCGHAHTHTHTHTHTSPHSCHWELPELDQSWNWKITSGSALFMPRGKHSTSKQLGWWIFLNFFFSFFSHLTLQMFTRRNQRFCLGSIDWHCWRRILLRSQPGTLRMRLGRIWGEQMWSSDIRDSGFHERQKKKKRKVRIWLKRGF